MKNTKFLQARVSQLVINNWMFSIPFLGFILLLRTSPMMYDGWAGSNYYNNIGGLIKWTFYIAGPYYGQINGRLAANFFSGILESFPSEILLDLVNAFIMTMIVWSLCKILQIQNPKKKLFISIFYFSLVFFLPSTIRAYVVQIANSAYIPPILLSFLFFLVARKYLRNPKKSSYWVLLIMCILVFNISTWIEHTAFGFGVTLTISLIILTVRDKKNYPFLWISVTTALAGGAIMILAPSLRAGRTILSNDLISLIHANLGKTFKFLIYDNLIIVCIFFILLLTIMVKKGWLKSYYNKLVIIITTLLTISLIFLALNRYVFENSQILELENYIYLGIINSKLILLTFFIGSIILIISGSVLIHHKSEMILSMSFALFTLLPVIATPNMASRVAFASLFMIIVMSIILLSELEISRFSQLIKTIHICIIFIGLFALDQEILLCRRIAKVTAERETLISKAVIRQKMGDWDIENDALYLPYYREGDVHQQGIVNEGSFHYPLFLNYYDLADETLVRFTNSSYYWLSFEQSGEFVTFKVETRLKTSKDRKYFYVFQNTSGQSLFTSIDPVGKVWEVILPEGTYKVEVYHCVLSKDAETIEYLQLIEQPITITVEN